MVVTPPRGRRAPLQIRSAPATCISESESTLFERTELPQHGVVHGGEVQDGEVQQYRLQCSAFWVDVRLLDVNGRWIASADTPDGPSLGCGSDAFEALWQALEPFEGVVGELLASLPSDAG